MIKFTSQFIIAFFGIIVSLNVWSQEILESPNSKIRVKLNNQSGLNFSVELGGELMIEEASVDLLFDNQSVFAEHKFKTKRFSIEERSIPIVSYKNEEVINQCNVVKLTFRNGASIEFRAYDEGIAYRFVTKVKNEVTVNERLNLNISQDYKTWASLQPTFQSSYQKAYTKVSLSKFPDSLYSYLPFLLGGENGKKILLAEADHYDYPHMFLKKGKEQNQLVATFPGFPLKTELYSDRRSRILQEADYIAETSGDRSFPWRVFFFTENDGQLIESDLVYNLSRGGSKEDNSWIKPGRVAWDWWNASNLYGVDFESGLNTNTWKYYIDFAAKNGLEYIILDEGWSVSTTDLTRPNPETNLQYLIDYGKEKGVGIILWATWRALNTQWEVLDKFVEWGAAGVKVDFMDRADQWMVNFYEKAARETYKRKLMIDFHGAFKPTGLRRAYPNVVSYEGVGGLEESKWSAQNTPEFNLELPFIRMVCGPMDYTPGAMRNFHSRNFKWNFYRPSSQGTRAHQVALFVVYESGLQMFADSPSNYEREEETTSFLSKIPNTWDETKVLEAKVGEYLVIARRKDDRWFIAGLTNGKERSFDIRLDFLQKNQYEAEIMMDGINSDKFAEDYKLMRKQVSKTDTLKLTLHKEGGYAAILK